MIRSYNLEYIEEKLYGHVAIIKSRTKRGLTDYNVYSEDFTAALLNVLKGWKLKNANDKKANTPGIDLIDKEKKILVQITSDCSISKIRSTLHNSNIAEYKDYHLYFLFLCDSDKRKHLKLGKLPNLTQNMECSFFESDKTKYIIFEPTNDLMDIDDILQEIQHHTDSDIQERIFKIIKTELDASWHRYHEAEVFNDITAKPTDHDRDQRMLNYLFEHIDTNMIEQYLGEDPSSMSCHLPMAFYNWDYISSRGSFVLYDVQLNALFNNFMKCWRDAMRDNEINYESRQNTNFYFFYGYHQGRFSNNQYQKEYDRIDAAKHSMIAPYREMMEYIKSKYRVDFLATSQKFWKDFGGDD